VLLQDVTDSGGLLIAAYNLPFNVLSLISETSFQVLLDSLPPADPPTTSLTNTFERLWEVTDFTFEENMVELRPALNTGGATSEAIILFGVIPPRFSLPTLTRTFWRYRKTLIRENAIRYATTPRGDNPSGNPDGESAISLTLVEQGMVRQNRVDLQADSPPATPIRELDSGTISYFANSTPQGILIQGWLQNTSTLRGELTTLIDEAHTLALL
jgi:hypothetical protein